MKPSRQRPLNGGRSRPAPQLSAHESRKIYSRYGAPDVVQITDVAKPVPKDNEVLIRVRAASVNPHDWHFVRGTPYILRLGAGLRKPNVTRLGVDLAGQVEAVGRNVTQFKPGDQVFGVCRGALQSKRVRRKINWR